ncbi:MAG: hypothetical protein FWE82_07575 [Defluviitaleaceae bacterium]|nr:hypothetical protein [Defluviitaleaceae bacterium]
MKLKKIEIHEFVTPLAKMEGKWWDIRKGYGLSQSNSYGEGVGRLFWALKLTADNGCEGLMAGRVPTGSYGSGLVGNDLNKGQDFNDTKMFDWLCSSFGEAFDAVAEYNIFDTEQILCELYESGKNGGISEALLDLKGNYAGLPIHQMAGGMGRKKIKAYASSFCDMGTPDEYADHAQDCYDMGYRGYKIHPYRCLNPATMKPAGKNTAFPDWDIEICRAVKNKMGDKMKLMLDPDGIYPTLEDAIRVGRELEKLGFYWYEAPIIEREQPERYGELRKAVKVPMCGPENAWGGFKTRVLWHQNGWTDILRPGGGFTDIIKTATYAQAVDARCEIHGGGFIAAQSIAIFPESVTEFYEQLLVQPGHSEFGIEEVAGSEPAFENGFFLVPQTPGAGWGADLWPYAASNSLRHFEKTAD